MTRGDFTRIGPRPIGLHLGLTSTSLAGALANLSFAKEGTLPWCADLQEEGKELTADMASFEMTELAQAIGEKGNTNLGGMLEGIRKYHAHPYRRQMHMPEPCWAKGNISVLDYGEGLDDLAPVTFIVPSLVNRAYILDLMEERSFVRNLSRSGIRPLLLDWGDFGEEEKDFSLDTYIQDYLLPAFDAMKDRFPNSPFHLIGYCMGGTISVALAQFRQPEITSFIALASPWNFHSGLPAFTKTLFQQGSFWRNCLEVMGEMPVDLLQTFFASLDPSLCLKKFTLFNRMDMGSGAATEFVALEDWLNDGVPLAKQVALDCFSDWYGENKTYQGEWQVDGITICPEKITIPVMIAAPKSDKIVPYSSAVSLAESVSNASVISPPSGHIGMIAGSRAPQGLWRNIYQWINN
ncbi:MAG: alpha/beta fold hydrolase [Sneathiellales bacterium]|nr:alpha/beta fold hydrolase [Sneathiellales bacterium]